LDKQLARLSRLSIRAAENHHVELQAYKQSREADRRIVDIELVEAKDALDAHQRQPKQTPHDSICQERAQSDAHFSVVIVSRCQCRGMC
jgi:hypothetical protein